MHALFHRDHDGREQVTLHASRDVARAELLARLRLDWPATLGERPTDDDDIITTYFAAPPAIYAIVAVRITPER